MQPGWAVAQAHAAGEMFQGGMNGATVAVRGDEYAIQVKEQDAAGCAHQ